jgi:hypothetical protein
MLNATTNQSGQFLMLGLVGEVFAVDATVIREILDPVPVAEVPGARSFLRGVINVRGKIVPMADLRIRFGMEPTAVTPDRSARCAADGRHRCRKGSRGHGTVFRLHEQGAARRHATTAGVHHRCRSLEG